MGLFDRFKRTRFAELERFVKDKGGVEAYVEPATGINPQSLLLVARDGTWAREQLADRTHAERFARDQGIPLYDAAVVGYPERMVGGKGRPAPEAPSPEELHRWFSAPEADRDDGDRG